MTRPASASVAGVESRCCSVARRTCEIEIESVLLVSRLVGRDHSTRRRCEFAEEGDEAETGRRTLEHDATDVARRHRDREGVDQDEECGDGRERVDDEAYVSKELTSEGDDPEEDLEQEEADENHRDELERVRVARECDLEHDEHDIRSDDEEDTEIPREVVQHLTEGVETIETRHDVLELLLAAAGMTTGAVEHHATPLRRHLDRVRVMMMKGDRTTTANAIMVDAVSSCRLALAGALLQGRTRFDLDVGQAEQRVVPSMATNSTRRRHGRRPMNSHHRRRCDRLLHLRWLSLHANGDGEGVVLLRVVLFVEGGVESRIKRRHNRTTTTGRCRTLTIQTLQQRHAQEEGWCARGGGALSLSTRTRKERPGEGRTESSDERTTQRCEAPLDSFVRACCVTRSMHSIARLKGSHSTASPSVVRRGAGESGTVGSRHHPAFTPPSSLACASARRRPIPPAVPLLSSPPPFPFLTSPCCMCLTPCRSVSRSLLVVARLGWAGLGSARHDAVVAASHLRRHRASSLRAHATPDADRHTDKRREERNRGSRHDREWRMIADVLV